MGRKAVSILFYGISVVLTGLLLVAAVLCRYASSVSPGEGGFWATLALLMPVVLLANVVALVWWAVRRKWIVLLMPLVALVLNLGYISAMVQLPDFKERGNPHDIRIATLNVNGFRQLGPKSITAAAVVTYRSARKTAALKLNLRDAASKYVELAHLQYRAGSTNYIDVLDAQRRYFDAQIGLSNSVRDEHLALVQLYKALGGGWTE